MTNEEIVSAAAKVLMNTVVDLIEGDSHQFGTRPCQTCRAISSILNYPFGCVKRANKPMNTDKPVIR